MDVLTQTTQMYLTTFRGFMSQFLHWGQILFMGLLTLNLLWLFLWYAFDKESIAQSLSDFIKRFFIMLLFYSIMLHPEWLFSIVESSQKIGQGLSKIPLHPSGIIEQGIAIANKVLEPAQSAGLLQNFISAFVAFVAYLVILFSFITIALEVALTLIVTTALIAIASLFLGFAALQATSQIARQTLDAILGNCVKLLGLYLVIAAGGSSITELSAQVPQTWESLDPYVWIVATSLLFWLVAKNLPNQLARIVSGCIQDHHGTSSAAIVFAGLRTAQMGKSIMSAVGTGLGKGLALAGSVAHHAAARFPNGVADMAMGTVKDLGSSIGGSLSDRAHHIASKSVGGTGVAARYADIPSVSQRMHSKAQDVKASRAKE